MPITPEDRARENIDLLLTGAGWIVQDKRSTNLSAGRGVAVREFPLKSGHGEADLEDLREDCIPLPPLDEQSRIVSEVQRNLSNTDFLEAELKKQLGRAARLRQSILKRAFEGELVPQDPNDEPASVLLERIRAERTHVKQSANGSRRSSPRREKKEDAVGTR